jgi:hypothetical protein
LGRCNLIAVVAWIPVRLSKISTLVLDTGDSQAARTPAFGLDGCHLTQPKRLLPGGGFDLAAQSYHGGLLTDLAESGSFSKVGLYNTPPSF